MEPVQQEGVWKEAPHKVMDPNSSHVDLSLSLDLDEIINFGSDDAKSMALKLHAFYNMAEVLLKFKDICSSNLDTILQDAVVKIMSMIGSEYLSVTKAFVRLGLRDYRDAQDLLNHSHKCSHEQHRDGENKGNVNAAVIASKDDEPSYDEISHNAEIDEICKQGFAQNQNNSEEIFYASEFLTNEACRLPLASTPKPTLQEHELVEHFENFELNPAPDIIPSDVYHNLALNQMYPGMENFQIPENYMWLKPIAPSLIQQSNMNPCQTNAHVPAPVYSQTTLHNWLPQYNIPPPPVGQFPNESNRYLDFYNDAYLESRVASSQSAFLYQQAYNVVENPTSTINKPLTDFLQSAAMSFPAPNMLQQNFIMKKEFSSNPNFMGNYCPPINNGVSYRSTTDGMMPSPSYQIENTVESVSPFTYLNGFPFLSPSSLPLSPLLSAVSVMRGCERTSSNSNFNFPSTSERVSLSAAEELYHQNEPFSGKFRNESFTMDSLCLDPGRDEETASNLETLDRPENIISNKGASASNVSQKYSDEVSKNSVSTSLLKKCAKKMCSELPDSNQFRQEKVDAVLDKQCENHGDLPLNIVLPNHLSAASSSELGIYQLFCSYPVHELTKDRQSTSIRDKLLNRDTQTSMKENSSGCIQSVPDICSLLCRVSEDKKELERIFATSLSFRELASDHYSISQSHLSNNCNEKINTLIKQLEDRNSSQILHNDKRSSIFYECTKLHHCQNCCKSNQCSDATVCCCNTYLQRGCFWCSKKRHGNCNNCRTSCSYNHSCHCCCTGTLTCHVLNVGCPAPNKYVDLIHCCRIFNCTHADNGATPHTCRHRCCYRRPESCVEENSTKCANLKAVSHSEMCVNLWHACRAISKLCHSGPTNCCCKIDSVSTNKDTSVRNVMVSDSWKISCSGRENFVIKPHASCQPSLIVRKIGKNIKSANKVKKICRYKKKHAKILNSTLKPSNVKFFPQKCVSPNFVLNDTEWETFDETCKTPNMKLNLQDSAAGKTFIDSSFSTEYRELKKTRTFPFQEHVYRLDFTQQLCASTGSNICTNMKQQFNCKCIVNVDNESSPVGAPQVPVVNNENGSETKLDPANLVNFKQNQTRVCARSVDFTKKTELHSIRNKIELNGRDSIQSSSASILNKSDANEKQFIGVKRLISLFENVAQVDKK